MTPARNPSACARRIFRAALAAVDPRRAVRENLSRLGARLLVGGGGEAAAYDLAGFERVWVVGAGKASARMAQACEERLGSRLAGGLVVVKYGHAVPLRRVEVVEAGHPIPDAAGLRAARRIWRLLEGLGEGDLVLAVLSGGGSALLTLPAEGITLAAKQRLTARLLACGADIAEVNAVRKHLSRVKGGQLARVAAPATVVVLAVSDVVGDDLSTIASGPFAPDPTTFAQAVGVLERHGLWERAPAAVRGRLERGAAGELPETPKPGERLFRRVSHHLVATNRQALRAARAEAERLGLNAAILGSTIQGEAREVARVYGALLREEALHGSPLPRPVCLLAGGETTVTIRGRGKGGRNMELALAVALEIDGLTKVAMLSGATDGTDGPTDAAGGLVIGRTCARARRRGLDPSSYLNNNDSYGFFERLGELFRTGPTLTNVSDLHLLLAL